MPEKRENYDSVDILMPLELLKYITNNFVVIRTHFWTIGVLLRNRTFIYEKMLPVGGPWELNCGPYRMLVWYCKNPKHNTNILSLDEECWIYNIIYDSGMDEASNSKHVEFLALRALKICKRYEPDMKFIYTSFFLPTSNIWRRQFSCAGYILHDINKWIAPK